MKTPEEAYSGKRLDVGHFRIFGSSVYCHVTKYTWKKLELTTKLGIFVRYLIHLTTISTYKANHLVVVTKIHLIIYNIEKVVLVNVLNNINHTYCIQMLQIN